MVPATTPGAARRPAKESIKMRKPSTAQCSTLPCYGRRWPRIAIVMAMLLGLLVPILQTSSAYAATVTTTASFTGGTGTAMVGNTLYARNTGTNNLTLTVNTSPATMCIDVTGAQT